MIETLKGIVDIDGVGVISSVGSKANVLADDHNFVVIDHGENSVKFKLQNGVVKKKMVKSGSELKEISIPNGCQVDTIIAVCAKIVDGLNKKFPCKENKVVLDSLNKAFSALKARTADRTERNVEGKEEL